MGGGHSHAIVLKLWGMNPLPNVRLTLITDVYQTPYSGMLPGYIAGFYTFEETHINLSPLCDLAQTHLICDRAIGLDLKSQTVLCERQSPVPFDILSLDIGSTPAKNRVPGANQYAISAKPVPQFLQAWNQFLREIQQHPQQPRNIGIVGGGAGGVELALTMDGHLRRLSSNADQIPFTIHLIDRGDRLLDSHNSWVSRKMQEILIQRGIQLHLQQEVCQVTPESIHSKSGLVIHCNPIFWLTQASAPDWIQDSGLATDQRGFVAVNQNLQSLSHPDIFAAGDIATMVKSPRPKAGVFAVRQGKPLFDNLQRKLSNQPLKAYSPQKRFLGLIGTGDQKAIASWGNFGWGASRLLWKLKDYIDREFMKKFNQ